MGKKQGMLMHRGPVSSGTMKYSGISKKTSSSDWKLAIKTDRYVDVTPLTAAWETLFSFCFALVFFVFVLLFFLNFVAFQAGSRCQRSLSPWLDVKQPQRPSECVETQSHKLALHR